MTHCRRCGRELTAWDRGMASMLGKSPELGRRCARILRELAQRAAAGRAVLTYDRTPLGTHHEDVVFGGTV